MSKPTVNRFTVLGERCSGTNFLIRAIQKNFTIEVTWDYGWKHFFGKSNYENSDATLFIGIVRDPYKWLNSFYRSPHHLQLDLRNNVTKFLNGSFWSIHDDSGQEILDDRNFLTGHRYTNIYECRKVKCQYLLDTMPMKVKNYILIRYEDLRDQYLSTLCQIQSFFSLTPKNAIFITIDTYKGEPNSEKFAVNESEILDRNEINCRLDFEIEQRLGYVNNLPPKLPRKIERPLDQRL
jgi:hypothetical protein